MFNETNSTKEAANPKSTPAAVSSSLAAPAGFTGKNFLIIEYTVVLRFPLGNRSEKIADS
jgi:hypothetical protein